MLSNLFSSILTLYAVLSSPRYVQSVSHSKLFTDAPHLVPQLSSKDVDLDASGLADVKASVVCTMAPVPVFFATNAPLYSNYYLSFST